MAVPQTAALAGPLVKYSDGVTLFDGWAVLSLNFPTGHSFATISNQLVPQRVGDKFRVRIEQGVYDQSVRVYQSTSLQPPNTQYSALFYDSEDVLLGATGLFSVTANPFTVPAPVLELDTPIPAPLAPPGIPNVSINGVPVPGASESTQDFKGVNLDLAMFSGGLPIGNGATDATAALNAAIAAASGRSLRIPAGTYLHSPITIPVPISITLEEGATLLLAPASTSDQITVAAQQVSFYGPGTIDGNAGLNPPIGSPGEDLLSGIRAHPGFTGVTIDGVTLQNHTGSNVKLSDVGNHVRNCTFNGNGTNQSACYFDDHRQLLAIVATAGSWSAGLGTLVLGTHPIVVGQFIHITASNPSGYDTSGVAVQSITASTISYKIASDPGAWTSGSRVVALLGVTDSEVVDCTFLRGPGDAVFCVSSPNNKISGNNISGYDRIGIEVIHGSHGSQILGNRYVSTSNATNNFGISMDASIHCVCTGNRVEFVPQGANTGIIGIELASGSDYCNVSDNVVVNAQNPMTITQSSNCIVGHNFVDGILGSSGSAGIAPGVSGAGNNARRNVICGNRITFLGPTVHRGIFLQSNNATADLSGNEIYGNSIQGDTTVGSEGIRLENDSGTFNNTLVAFNNIKDVPVGIRNGAGVLNTVIYEGAWDNVATHVINGGTIVAPAIVSSSFTPTTTGFYRVINSTTDRVTSGSMDIFGLYTNTISGGVTKSTRMQVDFRTSPFGGTSFVTVRALGGFAASMGALDQIEVSSSGGQDCAVDLHIVAPSGTETAGVFTIIYTGQSIISANVVPFPVVGATPGAVSVAVADLTALDPTRPPSIVTTNLIQSGGVATASKTVATLPSPLSAQETNSVYRVTDALAPINGATVVGGGSVKVFVFTDGTAWKVMGAPTNLPHSMAFSSATQSIPNSASTAILFNTNVEDTGSIHSVSVNTSRFTVPVAGWYQVIGQAGFVAMTAGSLCQINVMKNGTTFVTPLISTSASAQAASTLVQASGYLRLAATDFIEFAALQVSGGAINLAAAQSFGSIQFVSS